MHALRTNNRRQDERDGERRIRVAWRRAQRRCLRTRRLALARRSGGCVVYNNSNGTLASISNAEAVAAYAYTGDLLDAGFTLTLAGGGVFSREVRRSNLYVRGQVHAVTNVSPAATNAFRYSYDLLNRPVSRNSDAFAYNSRGEVASATVGIDSASYTYDGIGNATTSAWNGVATTYSANALNQYELATKPGGHDWMYYSENGELAYDSGMNYVYDARSRLVAAGEWVFDEERYLSGDYLDYDELWSIVGVSNRYDHLDRRVQKITPAAAHTYFYDGWMLIKEVVANTNGTTDVVEYHWGKDLSGTIGGAGGVGGLLYLKRNGAIFVPWYDAYGNVMGYWDAQGNVVAEYIYDAFGKLIASSGPMANVFSLRYSTKYFDSETGFYYYGRRFYSPKLMRWITRDPIGEEGGVNLYGFCHNAAVSVVDLLGNVPSGVTFLNAYSPYDYNHKGREIWKAVGGSLKRHLWNDETVDPPNSCATRITIALIKSNEPIPNGSRQYINTLKRGEQGIAGNYIVGAGKMQDYLTSAWGTASKLSPTQAYYFKSKVKKGDIYGLREEIEEKLKCSNVPKDKYVCVVSSKVNDEPGVSGHIGMVTKTYADQYMPYRDNPVVWILPPTKTVTTQKK